MLTSAHSALSGGGGGAGVAAAGGAAAWSPAQAAAGSAGSLIQEPQNESHNSRLFFKTQNFLPIKSGRLGQAVHTYYI